MDKSISEKEFRKFILEVSKLQPIEFMGLTQILCVNLFEDDEKKTPREFETLLSEVLDRYMMLARPQRRSIMKMIKLSNLGKIEG